MKKRTQWTSRTVQDVGLLLSLTQRPPLTEADLDDAALWIFHRVCLNAPRVLGPHPKSAAPRLRADLMRRQRDRHHQPQLNRFASAKTLFHPRFDRFLHVAEKGPLRKYKLRMEIQV